MSQSSLLVPLLLLIYINDLHVAIKYLEMHNFADEVNVRKFNSCVKPINKQIKFDLKNFANWSNANKTSFNFSKIELALFDRDFKIQTKWKKAL